MVRVYLFMVDTIYIYIYIYIMTQFKSLYGVILTRVVRYQVLQIVL